MIRLFFQASVSVFLCCLVYEYFDVGTGVPFYAGIAAIICMQSEVSGTIRIGLNRTTGTLIGGITGMLILFLIREIPFLSRPFLKYAIISACILPLMWIADRVKRLPLPHPGLKDGEENYKTFSPWLFLSDFMRKSALTNITCIAFLSVAISHQGDVAITTFAFNRILDTLIGVFSSLGISMLPFPRSKPKHSDGDDSSSA